MPRLPAFAATSRAREARSSKVVVGGALLSAWLAAPTLARADPPGDVAQRGRAFFDAATAYWIGAVTLPTQNRALSLETDALGAFGYRRFAGGFGLGYAFSERVIAGARLDVAVLPRERDQARLVGLEGTLSPFVQILFAREREVRPFLILRAGMGTGRTFVRKGQSVLEERDAPVLFPTVGVGAGAHAFLSHDVSFDAALLVDHRWNFRRTTADGGLDTVEPKAWQLRDSSISATLLMGFSRWF